MPTPEQPTFNLDATYIHIHDGPAAIPLGVAEDFWNTIDRRTDLHDGRLVCLCRYTEDWPTWEAHPAGDEIVYLLSGAGTRNRPR